MIPYVLVTSRSSFSEEFRDAAGFGWSLNGTPPVDLKALIEKKVSVYLIFIASMHLGSLIMC